MYSAPPGEMPKVGHDPPSKTFWVIMGMVGLATLGLAVGPVPILAVLPTAGVALAYTLYKIPLRIPAMTLLFLGLVLDNPADNGPWKSPLFDLGELLLVQLKKVIPIDALVITGMDAALAVLVGLHFYRRLRGLSVDTHPYVKTPPALILACLAAIVSVLFSWAFGLATGGDFRWSLWQLMHLLHLPVATLMFSVLLPGPSIAPTLAKIYIVASLIKSVIAVGVSFAFPDSAFMTSHQDSILFATGSCCLAIGFLEAPSKKSLLLNGLLQPVLMLGMVVNDRRLVWVQLAFALGIVFFLSNWSWLKFRLLRVVIGFIPAMAMYLAIGWQTAGTGVFKPISTLKSMTDSKSDSSTLWRDLENFNLQQTLSTNKLLGTGLGHEFNEVITLPDVTAQYEMEPYWPHNNMLGVWAYTGYVGFTIWWSLLGVMTYCALRGYMRSRSPPLRTATMLVPAVLVVYMIHCMGDLGLGSWHGVLLVSASAIIAAKQGVATGAWVELPRPTLPTTTALARVRGRARGPGRAKAQHQST